TDMYNSDYSCTDANYLRIYDCSTKQWQSLTHPLIENEQYGPGDFRLIDNNLYLIFYNHSCLINTMCVIYLYDLYNNKWTEMAWGDIGCSFEGNRIKVLRYNLIKEGDCSANNEYEEVIDWIDLK
ncbi:MAG: hypothetical protein K2L93_02880, partial [Muribaculaceae bacterium]|nr:hypothetical protein [Muribaculaceae bacterium]